MNLYEIDARIQNFEFEIDEDTGEILNLLELDQLEIARNEKIENIALYDKNLKAEIEAIDNEVKALLDRRKAKQNKADNLLEYLKTSLQGAKFETSKVSISYRKSKSVEFEDEEKFLQYAKENDLEILYKETVSVKPNKKEIKDFITKTNGELPYVHIKENVNMQIK